MLGITPKIFLHNLFAKHIDNSIKNYGDKPYQYFNSGFNCNCDNLVAESNFENNAQVFTINVSATYCVYAFQKFSFHSIPGIYSPLRGPPVNS